MFTTYILKSLHDGKYYYGHCSNLNNRIKRHNSGMVKSTKSRIPFELHYSEQFDTKSEAFRREQFFKTINGWIWLKENGII